MRINTQILFYILVCWIIALLGCASPKPRLPVAPAASTSYLDLQPGWRLRVVTPLLRSGGYRLTPKTQSDSANTITLATENDFLGYEISYYLVRRKRWAGLTIRFLSAETIRDGVTRVERRSTVKLFQLPRGRRYIRLIYLRRVSQADHDMAILAADNSVVLAAATKQVQTDAAACHNTGELSCSWAPAGIAVIAERPRDVNGTEEWVSAR